MATIVDVRREAVLAIERALSRQFEVMQLPIPKHYWMLSTDSQCSEAELVCVADDGEKIVTEFSGEELDRFNQNARFSTYAKLSRLASRFMADDKKPCR